MDFDALEYSDNVMDWAITNIARAKHSGTQEVLLFAAI